MTYPSSHSRTQIQSHSRPGQASTRWAPCEGRGGPRDDAPAGRESELGEGRARARSTARHSPSLTPGSLDWSMLTSAMLGRGPGCRAPPASRPPPAAKAAPRAVAAPDAAQSPGGSARGPGGRSEPLRRDRRQRRRETCPGTPDWRPSCPAAATCSRAPCPDRYQIPEARKWARAVQYGGREETERRAGGPDCGGGGELQVCNRNREWLASEDQLPRPPPCCLLCAV